MATMEQKNDGVKHLNILKAVVHSVYGSLKTPVGREVAATLPPVIPVRTGAYCTLVMTRAPIVYDGPVEMRRHPTMKNAWVVTQPPEHVSYQKQEENKIRTDMNQPVILTTDAVEGPNGVIEQTMVCLLQVHPGLMKLHVKATIRHITTHLVYEGGVVRGRMDYNITHLELL